MTQKLSPYIEAKYGWSVGEDGWNTGVDENFLKFSYLFDRNIDAIVDTLPAAENNKSYYLTTDKRVYYTVNSVYYSTPLPLYFTLFLKSNGSLWQYNGTTLVSMPKLTDLQTSLNSKANINSPSFTGTPTSVTPALGNNSTQIATTAFISSTLSGKADLASPAFTGVPTAPTAAAGTSTTQIATTAFVNALKNTSSFSSATGFWKDASTGWMMQWITVTTAGSASIENFSFPTSFSAVCVGASPIITPSPGGGAEYIQIVSTSSTGLSLVSYTNTSGPTLGVLTNAKIMAFGY